MRLNLIGSVHVVLGKHGTSTARLCAINYRPLPWARAEMRFSSRERLLGYLSGLGQMLSGRYDLFVPVENDRGTVTYVRRDQAAGYYPAGWLEERLSPKYDHLAEWRVKE